MGKTLILGNNPDVWWGKDIKEAEYHSVPNISVVRNTDITNYLLTLPDDAECVVIDADSLDSSNVELPLDLILHLRLMLHECRKSSLSSIVFVSELEIETYKGYGVKSIVLMTQNITYVGSEDVRLAVENSKPMTPGEYVAGFLELIKIEPQEKVEGRHSIANEWGAEALYNVVSGGEKTNIVPIRATSSLYFKYSNVAALDANDVGRIINGKVPRYLTSKLNVTDCIRYLLIDDEAEKGWTKVLGAILPNAIQDVWDQPVNTYEEISEEIRKKITSGDYDLIFLDLRMTGVAEDSVMKPEEFSGMSILKAIKRINAGIQVIMLTATNKAWNLKALMDAGANGYYMKESPEYHFPLKYSEQNAVALIAVIKACIRNSYLQDIVDQQKKLILPPDSELSDHIYTQLSIAVSLILSARTESEYAFAYISLEQIFEIASSFLIRQVHNRDGDIYYFTEDAHEQCRLYQNGKPDGYLQSYGKNRAVAQWKKIAAIYHQLYGGTVKDFGEKVKKLINLRNEYIHPSKGMKPSITHDDFIDLFETILTFLSVFK